MTRAETAANFTVDLIKLRQACANGSFLTVSTQADALVQRLLNTTIEPAQGFTKSYPDPKNLRWLTDKIKIANGPTLVLVPDNVVSYLEVGDKTSASVALSVMAIRSRELYLASKPSAAVKLSELSAQLPAMDAHTRARLLPKVASLAYQANDLDRAIALAQQALQELPDQCRSGFSCGTEYHQAHLVLGMVAAKRNDLRSAASELAKSADVDPSPTLSSFGPSMALAQVLLAKGQRQQVVAYLERCKAFWRDGTERLNEWTGKVGEGGTPDFGANAIYYLSTN